jgi:hypothetical protein
MLALVALCLATGPGLPAAEASDFAPERPVPPHLRLVKDPPAAQLTFERVTYVDAPVSGLTAFGASALTAMTGLFNLMSIALRPPPGLPMSTFALHARISASLLLMSVGPSMGDLLTHNTVGFLIGAGGRTLLAGLSYATVMLMQGQGSNPLVVLGGLLFVTMAALAWTGWGGADLVRAFFAPDRWVVRENARRRAEARSQVPSRPPTPAPGEPGVFRM